MENISAIDFYEKYFVVKTPNGTVKPPPLTDAQKDVMAIVEKSHKEGKSLYWSRKAYRGN